MAGRGGESPIADERAEGVWGGAGGAVGAGVPDAGAAGWRRGRTGDGTVGVEGVVEGVVFEAALDEDCFVDGAPGIGSIETPFVPLAPVESSGSFPDSL